MTVNFLYFEVIRYIFISKVIVFIIINTITLFLMALSVFSIYPSRIIFLVLFLFFSKKSSDNFDKINETVSMMVKHVK